MEKKTLDLDYVVNEEMEDTSPREVNAKAIETIAHYAEKLDSIQSDINEIKTDITVIMAKQE